MAARNPQTHAKRARELALREKRERKAEKKAERRAEAAAAPEDGPETDLTATSDDDGDGDETSAPDGG